MQGRSECPEICWISLAASGDMDQKNRRFAEVRHVECSGRKKDLGDAQFRAQFVSITKRYLRDRRFAREFSWRALGFEADPQRRKMSSNNRHKNFLRKVQEFQLFSHVCNGDGRQHWIPSGLLHVAQRRRTGRKKSEELLTFGVDGNEGERKLRLLDLQVRSTKLKQIQWSIEA